jgi:Zn-dependent protease
VFLSEPGQTDYDIRFSLFGFPIRVHPAFFIAPVLFGRGLIAGSDNVGVALLIVTAIFFASILLHELGHSIAFKYFGIDSRIVLHWMGGLAIPEQSRTWGNQTGSAGLSSNAQMMVAFAGPLANILQAALAVGIGLAIGGILEIRWLLIPLPIVTFQETIFASNYEFFLLFYGFVVLNLFWALLNLMPVFPLDGGQMARAFMNKIDPRDGVRNSIYLSFGTAVLLTLWALTSGGTFMAIFFGFMAYSSWQMLQTYGRPRW